jgi:3-methyladenine DNA glycosylase AlkD
MRGKFEFYGVPSPLQRRIAREASRGLADPTETELADIAELCWSRPEREWQYFACGYLRRHVARTSASFLYRVEPLITSKPWWDTVDALAGHTVGRLVAEHSELAATMDEWIESDDLWLARTAILHQLHYKTATDRSRLEAYCLARAADKDFFIRKAIGWALREYSKTDETFVRDFVREHAGLLAPLSRREAMKWLARRGAREPRARPPDRGRGSPASP